MFERYSEKARRVVFYARTFASELGGQFIEPEHLLLAILQEDPDLFRPSLKSDMDRASLKAELEGLVRTAPQVANLGEMYLSHAAKRVLAHAAEEAEQNLQQEIRPTHLLAGILVNRDSAAVSALRRFGLETQQNRMVFVASSNQSAPVAADSRDLHQLVDRLPPEQLGRARALLQALVDVHRASGAS